MRSLNSNPLPKVTIAIPTLNRARYLRIALRSALSQTYPNIEVIVSNNASSDETADFLSFVTDERLRVVEQTATIGMMENWNACLHAASGKYFLLLSDDDVLEPFAIEELVNVFEDSECQGQKIGFVYCGGKTINSDGEILSIGAEVPLVEGAKELIVAFFKSKRNLWACSILYRKDDLAPGYDTNFPLLADAAQWIRAAISYGTAKYVSQNLVSYRVHNNATLKTSVSVWRKENNALAEFAIDELQKKGEVEDDISKNIRKAVQRLNVRVTVGLINQSHRDKKLKALSEYWANYRVFASVYGLAALMKASMFLMLPRICRIWWRRVRLLVTRL